MKEDTMIRAGSVFENSTTKGRILVLKTDAETNGNGWLLEHHSVPHSPPSVPEHLHLAWLETFEILVGDAFYKLDGVRHTARAGDTILMPARRAHIHPWNAGETVLVYRQLNVFEKPDAQAVQDILGVFATLAGLGCEGKLDADGRPKHPLQMAATLKTLNKHGSYDARLPIRLQDAISATIGSLAEAFGYRAIYPRFTESYGRQS